MIDPQHFQEWRDSCVDPAIIQLNVISLSEYEPHEYLLYSENLSRRNDGRLRDPDLRKYQHLELGGWWCSGLDPLVNWQPMDWGCLKPTQPRRADDGKLIKYEHPPKTNTRAFFHRMPLHIWHLISQRSGVAMPENIIVTPEGEALGFWPWVLEHPEIPLTITEGAKKAGALLTAGYAAVALPGVNSGYRTPKDDFGNPIGKKHLIPELKLFAVKGRSVYLCFDRDLKQKTVKMVNRAIGATGQLLSQVGCTVRVILWSQPEKGVDDLIAAHGGEAFDAAYKSAPLLETWQTLGYSQLTYPVSQRLKRRYLAELNFPSEAKLIGIKSPKGTGKTEQLAAVAQEAMANGQWVLVLTHRVQLGEELCRRLRVPYVTELRDSETGKLFGFGLCVDSLHPKSQARFSAEHWTDGVVIIDEAEQVLWHVLNSSTCKSVRVPILKELRQLITNVLNSDQGQVILSDADLSDVTLDYMQELAGVHLTPYIILNEWKPDVGWNVFHYQGTTPTGLVAALKQHIAEGGKPFICCSSQKVTGRFSTRNLEAYLKKRFPDIKILRIDSQTIADPSHPAFGCIQNLDTVLQLYDIVLASPSVETGVSIDLKGHFTSVWGIFQGVQAENAVRQFLARVRESVDRHIWVAPCGLNPIGNGSTSYKSLLASQHKLFKGHLNLLRDADFNPEDIIDGISSQASLGAWGKMACRINQGMIHYRQSVLDGLRAEGHQIIQVSTQKEVVQALDETLSENRDGEQQAEAEATAAVPLLSKEEYDKSKEKKQKTEDERRMERKYELGWRYAVEVTDDLVLKDDDNWYPKIQLHYYLSVGREHLPARDKKRLVEAREQGRELGPDGKDALWIPDFNKNQLSAKVALLDKLGVLNLLDHPDREFRGSDPDLQQLAEMLKKDPWAVKAILGLTINEKHTPIEIFQLLLGQLGMKLTRTGQDGTGKRERVYRSLPTDDGRDQVFAAWLARESAAAEVTHSTPVTSAQSQIQPTHTPGNKEYLDHQGCEENQDSPQTFKGEDAAREAEPAAPAPPVEENQVPGGCPSAEESWAFALRDCVRLGVNSVRTLLSKLKHEERWEAVLELEQRCEITFSELLCAFPGVFNWIDVVGSDTPA